MMNSPLEKYASSAIESLIGPVGMKVLKVIDKAAELQGGASTIENYQLLGKRALIVAGVAITAVNVGGMVVSSIVSQRTLQRRIEKAVAQALEQERQRERENDQARAQASGQAQEQEIGPASGRTFYQRYGKRACDVAVSVAALPIVGAVTAASGIAIKREDGGPVFYNAPRVGKDGREFTMFKLRSMKVNAPDLVMEDGSTYNGADDPRMTQVGAFLRKTSLDEIPQFLNVLRGDMSVVGPRPDLKRETELYQDDEALKLSVKPGVTGYAAVYGRNSLPWHDRLALDVEYVRNLSFPLDVKVFLKTFATVFKQEGIYVEDEQTPQESSQGTVKQ